MNIKQAFTIKDIKISLNLLRNFLDIIINNVNKMNLLFHIVFKWITIIHWLWLFKDNGTQVSLIYVCVCVRLNIKGLLALYFTKTSLEREASIVFSWFFHSTSISVNKSFESVHLDTWFSYRFKRPTYYIGGGK